jgi:dCTP deaminase
LILVDKEIKFEIANRNLGYSGIKINPYDLALVGPASLDLRLHSKGWSKLFSNEKRSFLPWIDPLDENTFKYETFDTSEYVLQPNEFIIASILERIELPANISGILCGKSSLARLGLEIHQTAGFCDAGFKGHIVLELKNVGNYPIKLTANMQIAQLIFVKHSECVVPYDKRKSSKYVNQCPGDGSKYYENKELV